MIDDPRRRSDDPAGATAQSRDRATLTANLLVGTTVALLLAALIVLVIVS